MTVDSPREAVPLGSTAPPSRTAAWLPWAVVALLATAVTLTVVLTDNSATVVEPAYPSASARRSVSRHGCLPTCSPPYGWVC